MKLETQTIWLSIIAVALSGMAWGCMEATDDPYAPSDPPPDKAVEPGSGSDSDTADEREKGDEDTAAHIDTGDDSDQKENVDPLDTGEEEVLPDTGEEEVLPDTGEEEVLPDTGEEVDPSDTAAETDDDPSETDPAGGDGYDCSGGLGDMDQCWPVPSTSMAMCIEDELEVDCANLACGSQQDNVSGYCGQDAFYPGNERELICLDADGETQACDDIANEGETVVDPLTAIQWQRATENGMTWREAMAYCEDLTYAGYDDWRLPNVRELLSIVDFDASPYAIDRSVFPLIHGTSFWTSSERDVDESGNAMQVLFELGYVVAPHREFTEKAVRCLRNRDPELNGPGRFETVQTGSGTAIVDHGTGLTWQYGTSEQTSWKNALSYCESLDSAGSTDWRLPDVNELVTIWPAAGCAGFPVETEGMLWTSTTDTLSVSRYAGSDLIHMDRAFIVSYDDWDIIMSYPKSSTTSAIQVRCVQ